MLKKMLFQPKNPVLGFKQLYFRLPKFSLSSLKNTLFQIPQNPYSNLQKTLFWTPKICYFSPKFQTLETLI
jgi:hypothetical protein